MAWITDSTAFISNDLLEHPDVYVVPLSIIFGDKAYDDGVDLTTDELYERLNKEKEVPKTSQPSVGRFAALYDVLKEEYEEAVAIHISSKLSGTIESSRSGAEMARFPVEVVDSKSMSYAITTLLYKGLELAEKGQSASTIAETLRLEANKSENFILLGNLDQFYKGGRMSGTQYLLGNILNIKPIIRINHHGEFELFEKVRSEKKAIKRLIELLQQSYEKHTVKAVQILHGNVKEKAEQLEQVIKMEFPDIETTIGEISSTIAVHAGEGTVAFIWHNE